MKKQYTTNFKKIFIVFTVFYASNFFALNTNSIDKANRKEASILNKRPSRTNLVINPTLSLDPTNATGAGGININTSACSNGDEILDNGIIASINSPDGTITSMVITITNPQDGANEQIFIGGTFTGVSVVGNGSQTLTITNTGAATNSTFISVLTDLLYKDLAVNPNTAVQRQLSIIVYDALNQPSNVAIAFFNVTKAANSGNSFAPIIIFGGGPNINLTTGLDGTQTAGGTWTDLNSTGALSGSSVNRAALPLGGSTFAYTVTGTGPCGNSTTNVLIIKMNSTELPVTSTTSCGAISTNYSDPTFSGNSNDPIYLFNSGANSGSLQCPAGSSGTIIYDWYKFNPTTNSYDNYALNSTRTQTNLPDGGYLIVRNDGGTILEGRAWVWNIGASIPNAGIDATICLGDNYSLNGDVGGLYQVYTHYNPVRRPFIIGPTTQISITFNATHTYISDLAFFMVSPDGTRTVVLASNQGNVCNPNNNVTNLTFTTQGAPAYYNFCSPATGPSTGTYNGFFSGGNPIPSNFPFSGAPITPNTNYLIDWSPFYGLNANSGGWKVQIYDCIGQDIGNLTGVTVTFDDGAGNLNIDTSGTIAVPINDNSCSAATASIYTIPSEVLGIVDQVLDVNPNIGLGASIGGWQWSYSTAGISGPWSDFNNDTLTPNIVANQDTWVRLALNNGISSCLTSDIMFIDTITRPTAGIGTTGTYSISSPLITLSSLLTGANLGGTWSLVSGSPGPGSFSAAAGTLNPATAGVGTYTFQYQVAASGPCPISTTTVTLIITASTNLSITKTASSLTPDIGSNVTFLITATNGGLSPATGVVVTDLLPTGYTFFSATPSTGVYISSSGIWTIGAIANGASETLSIVATVNNSGVYTNIATITGNESDPDLYNNTATVMPIPVNPCNANVTPNIN